MEDCVVFRRVHARLATAPDAAVNTITVLSADRCTGDCGTLKCELKVNKQFCSLTKV